MCVLAWATIVAAVGIPLMLTGVTSRVGPLALNVIGAVLLIVPVVLVLAWLESSNWHATVGKRALHLRVVRMPAQDTADTGASLGPVATTTRVTFPRALLRNTLKFAPPWILGHVVAIALSDTSPTSPPSAWLWVLTAAAYVLPIAYVASLFVRRGDTPYDAAARTTVVRAL